MCLEISVLPGEKGDKRDCPFNRQSRLGVLYGERFYSQERREFFFSSFLRELYLPYLHIAAKITAVCVPLRHHLYLAKSLQQPANFETPSFCPAVLWCFNIFSGKKILGVQISVGYFPRGEKGDKMLKLLF